MATEISAKVIADSISPTGSRLTTLELTYHRFILAELNTHRAFSRNTASSRAIPTAKLIERVRNDPAMPVEWGKNQPGMQATLQVNNVGRCEYLWVEAALEAADYAEEISQLWVHKQIVNRILEPFMWAKTIVSSTEWTNFFKQRISPLAQPEMRVLAERMKEALDASEPTPIKYSGWHVPYWNRLEDIYDFRGVESWEEAMSIVRKVSVARCARVSYLTHDGKRDIQKDLELYEKLKTADPPHLSPFEHVACPTPVRSQPRFYAGNFEGWAQLRHLPEYQ